MTWESASTTSVGSWVMSVLGDMQGRSARRIARYRRRCGLALLAVDNGDAGQLDHQVATSPIDAGLRAAQQRERGHAGVGGCRIASRAAQVGARMSVRARPGTVEQQMAQVSEGGAGLGPVPE